MALTIAIKWDSSVADAPPGFKAAVLDAVRSYENLFANPIIITIAVGYGEAGGQPLDPGAVGESETFFTPLHYTQIRTALAASATSADDAQALASLPQSDPTGGGSFAVTTAEAKALDLIPNNTQVDGYIGFSSTTAFTYDPNNRAVSGAYDLIGAAAHEISEVMGRFAGLGQNGYDTPMDLFRYSADGVRQLSPGAPAYFSVDGGRTDLNAFNTDPSGDLGDWAASAGNDSFLAFSNPGVEDPVTETDLRLLDILGYDPTDSTPPAASALPAAPGNLISGASGPIVLDNPPQQNPATVSASGRVTGTGADGIIGAAGFAWSLKNLGTIASTATGVALEAGGMIDNAGAITGSAAGVAIYGDAGTLLNSAAITAPGDGGSGVYLGAGGSVTNTGAIAAGYGGVEIVGGTGTVVNSGTISGTGADGFGVYLGGADSLLTNSGTIAGSGGTALALGGAGSVLTVAPGAVFVGAVDGAGDSALALAAGSESGTLAGLGRKFTGFGAVVIDPGAVWQLSGSAADAHVFNDGTIIVGGRALTLGRLAADAGTAGVIRVGAGGLAEFAGAVGPHERIAFGATGGAVALDRPQRFAGTIAGFQPGDAIDLVGRTADAVSFTGNSLVVDDNGATVAKLRLAGHYTAADFALSPDGHSGTDITVTAPQGSGASAAAPALSQEPGVPLGFWTMPS